MDWPSPMPAFSVCGSSLGEFFCQARLFSRGRPLSWAHREGRAMGKCKGLFDRCRQHVVTAILITLCGLSSTKVRALPPDPVEELRQSLKAPVLETAERDRNLRAQIRALSGINDLQRAVSLRDWRDEDPDDKVAAVDLANRAEVCRAFEQAVRDVLHHGDAASRLAVMNMLVKMAITTRGAGTKASIAHAFADDLANLTRQGDAGTREAAARSLGQVSPEPGMAVPVLTKLMESKEVRLKLAGVDGMVSMMKVATYLATR